MSLKGNLSFKQQDFIKTCTVVGQVRGEDGTGWIVNTSKRGPIAYKRAVCGSDFMGTGVGKKAVTALTQATAVIGHNRKTTSGGDDDNDCHPFSYSNVVGVHNGTVPKYVLSRLGNEKAVADVDSAEIYAALNSAKDPIDVLKNIHAGAYCLVWIDKKSKDVCIARNNDRPMWAASGDDGLYFASEPGMLFWLMSRYDLQAKDSKLYELDAKHLYRIPLDKPSDITRTEYKTTYPTYQSSSHRSASSGAGWYDHHGGYYGRTSAIHKYVSNPDVLTKSYPALRHIADIIIANFDSIKRGHVITKADPTPPVRRLDVVVTNVTVTNGNKLYPDVTGYVYDETNSDVTIPVQLLGVRDDGYDFHERYKAGVKKNQLFTLRGNVRNIRVCADGTVTLAMGIVNVWDNKANEPITDDTQIYAIEVDDAVGEKYSRFTGVQLDKMWDKLETTPTTTPAVVH